MEKLSPGSDVNISWKKRITQAADLEGIFRIIQSILSKRAEPVKKWLAGVGTLPLTTDNND